MDNDGMVRQKNRWNTVILVTVIIAVVILVGLSLSRDSYPNKLFTDQAGRFSVMFPGEPTTNIDTENTPIGSITIHNFELTKQRGHRYYGLKYADYPSIVLENTKPNVLLDAAAGMAISNSNAQVKTNESITISGYPGKDITMVSQRNGNQLNARAKVCLAGNRIYVVVVVLQGEDISIPDAMQFIDSFQIKQK